MKKGTSFYLEEDILKEIEIYKQENGLNSKNTALERIILEYKTIKMELEYTRVLADYAKSIMSSDNPVVMQGSLNKNVEKEEDKKSNSKFRNSIKNSYNQMDE